MTGQVIRRGHVALHLTDEPGPKPSGTAIFRDEYGTEHTLAGERMVLEYGADGTTTVYFNDVGTGRQCGDCQLCCKLMPILSLSKPANTRCKHQRSGKGCTIYAKRPVECRTFACRWLADPTTKGLKRPDRSHLVIDPEWDSIVLERTAVVAVMQVWVDPSFPDAWDTPEFRAHMLFVAEKYRAATLIRRNSRDAITVFPPPLADDGQWHIQEHGTTVSRDDLEKQIAAMGKQE